MAVIEERGEWCLDILRRMSARCSEFCRIPYESCLGGSTYTRNGNTRAMTTATTMFTHQSPHHMFTASSPHTATPTVTIVENPMGKVPRNSACEASASIRFQRKGYIVYRAMERSKKTTKRKTFRTKNIKLRMCSQEIGVVFEGWSDMA